MAWHQKTGAAILLRVAGVAILALAWLAAAALHSRAMAAGAPTRDAVAWLLACSAFLCGSAGAGLAVLGPHIFDRIQVSRRWRRPDDE
jgi:cytochrome c oxidase assembly factor CtaG